MENNMMEVRRRGRPTKEMVAARRQKEVEREKPLSDLEVLRDVLFRFRMFDKLVNGTVAGNFPSLIVSGAPGVGKSETVMRRLRAGNLTYGLVKGGISASALFQMAYEYRHKGNLLVFDDSDMVFRNEDTMNILKALCDSGDERWVTWHKRRMEMSDDDGEAAPPEYIFSGSVIFLSNLSFADVITGGGSVMAPHMAALMSRSLYLPLNLFSAQAISVWIEYIATEGGMIRSNGLTDAQGRVILDFIKEHRSKFRVLSLRTLKSTIGLFKTEPKEWREFALATL
jgi:hypothetical protein